MRIIVAGGTGFVGSHLVPKLREKGHEVLILSRMEDAKEGHLSWKQIENGLPPCDALVNLAGHKILEKRWSPDFKKAAEETNLNSTKALVSAIKASKAPPKVFLQISAIGIYPPSEKMIYTESTPIPAPKSDDFPASLCHKWEKASSIPKSLKTRKVILRLGIALGKDGGALEKLIKPFRLGLGGSLGSGKQPFPWIHIDDVVGIIIHALEHDHVVGVLNGVAPHLVTYNEFATSLGSALKRPAFLHIPAFFLKVALGERAKMILENPRVLPQAVLASGYSFKLPQLDNALVTLV